MLYKIICTIFLSYILVLKSEYVQMDSNAGNYTIKHEQKDEISFQPENSPNKFLNSERLQIGTQQTLKNQLPNNITMMMGRNKELNESLIWVPVLENTQETLRTEQIRQSELLTKIIGKVNKLEANKGLSPISGLIKKKSPSSCNDLQAQVFDQSSGIHEILIPAYSRQPFYVNCDQDTLGGGWTIVLARKDGSVDFYLFWDDFKKGFGNLAGEFFIGLDKLHFMTRDGDQELLITMEDFEGNERFAKYDRFAIGSEEEAYKLRSLGKYSGDAGDSLKRHLGEKFSTRDRDNAEWEAGNCAKERQGAWWYFNYCHDSNLMGRYNDNTRGKGVNWFEFTGYETSLKRVQMMIRRRSEN